MPQIVPNAEFSTPHSVEAEQQLIGALLSNNGLMERVSGLLKAEHFFEALHGRIFTVIGERIDAGLLASPVTLKSIYENDAAMKELGGSAYLVRLAGSAVSQSQIIHYAQLIIEEANKRKLIDHFKGAREHIAHGQKTATEIALDTEAFCGSLSSQLSTKPLIRSHLSTIIGAVDLINSAYQNEVPPGVPSGIPALDKVLNNFRPGQLIVLDGRPAMGKTSVAQNIAYHAAENGHGVFFGSLEMMGEELSTRFISKGLAMRGTRIPYSRMIRGNLSEAEMRAVVDEAQRQQAWPMFVGERDVREVSRFRAAVRRAQQRMADTDCPLKVVFVDYIQQMQVNGAKSSYDRASAASDMMKSLAMELGLPVIAMAQLSRAVEQRDPPIPNLSDLRESGKLEEDADVVIHCYRNAYYLRKKLESSRQGNIDKVADLEAALSAQENEITLIVDKQRSGPTDSVTAYIDLPVCNLTPDKSGYRGELI